MNFMTLTVYFLLIFPVPLTLSIGAVSYVSKVDVADYERLCQHYFSLDCPIYGSESWNCSKIITNCTSPDYPYHCIQNTTGNVVHVCAAAEICQKGTVPIFNSRTHTISCEKCQKGFFQPLQVWSYNTPVCMPKFFCDKNYNKIECPVATEKEHTQDTLCRCDARNDFILSYSEGRENCVLGRSADCYEHKCPDGQERLQNYMCAPRCEEGLQRDDNDICVPKSTDFTTKDREKASEISISSTEKSSNGSSIAARDTFIALVSVIAALAVSLIAIVVAVCCWKRGHCCRKHSRVPIDHDPNALEHLTNNNVCRWRRGNCSRQHSREPSDNNAEVLELLTMNDESDGNTASRETRSQASPSGPELETMSNGINEIVWPGDSHNQVELSLELPSPDKLHQKVLNRCLPLLIKDLDFKQTMMYIQHKELFDEVTIRDIREQTTTSDSISLLIEKLKQKPQIIYEEFLECLVQANQEDLKKELEDVYAKVSAQDTV